MIVKGKKVVLRAVEIKDAELLQEMINDEEIERMMWGYSFPVSYHQQVNWIQSLPNDNSVFRAIIEVNEEAIGTIILSNIDLRNGNAQIHLKLAKSSNRGKGYGSDAVIALSAYAFNELRLNCIYCRVNEENIASQKMFTKCGFIKEGKLRSRVYKNGRFFDFYEYSLLKDEMIKY